MTTITITAPTTPRSARAHATAARGFVGLIVVQFFLAGLGMFGAANFDAHRVNGTLLLAVALALVVLAAVGRMSRAAVVTSAVLLVSTLVQGFLPGARDGAAVLAALHPVNALALLVLGYALARGRTLSDLAAPRG